MSTSTVNYFIDTSSLTNLSIGFLRTGFTQIRINIISIVVRECVNASHFYDASTESCIANCTAAGYSANDSNSMACSHCHYSCLTCTD